MFKIILSAESDYFDDISFLIYPFVTSVSLEFNLKDVCLRSTVVLILFLLRLYAKVIHLYVIYN